MLSPFWILVALPLVILLGLPLLLAALAVFVILNFGFAILRGPARPNVSRSDRGDSNLSPVIDNKEIGPYRVKQNPQDPSVIEVLD